MKMNEKINKIPKHFLGMTRVKGAFYDFYITEVKEMAQKIEDMKTSDLLDSIQTEMQRPGDHGKYIRLLVDEINTRFPFNEMEQYREGTAYKEIVKLKQTIKKLDMVLEHHIHTEKGVMFDVKTYMKLDGE